MAKIGKGAFGRIYKVKHKFDGKIYAVKQVGLTGKADSEVKALAKLDHPNIVRYITCWPSYENWTSNQVDNTSGSSSDVVFCEESNREKRNDDTGMASLGVTTDRTCLFIQMEFCEGGTLTEWIRARNQRITMEINKIFNEIVTGVEYIHANNLIHRDLKPDNILLSAEGKVKIGDFGLVAAQANENGDPIERSNKGTPTYMSPEQKEIIKKMLSFTPVDRPHATDIKENLDRFFSLDQNLKSLFLH
ncbi:Interferon-induced, double-stranded RNA-activated protein kinase [Anabarilius grahami]|uniref:Interferon-induced, double-stranded RNA-activated protein kinase n=1 Tax=Anabarilius grahami TaxID=495550 RepID=A0A3N0XX94_ANAGA|nr:Interferon-induced, double-stranded RNA-activated protein kinase [Anabarilius grahami]